jgi:hypothetical protein
MFTVLRPFIIFPWELGCKKEERKEHKVPVAVRVDSCNWIEAILLAYFILM